ncbi:MAG: ATP-binding cassette domain-containing protein [Pseudomonadota bacterium]
MATPPLLTLQDIDIRLGRQQLLDGAHLSVAQGERLCLIGRNGSGKSTLLKVAADMLEPDGGTRFLQPGTSVRYLPQEPDFSGFETTLAYVEAGLGPLDEIYRARYLLGELGLTGEEDPAHLSGGESRRAALARVLAPQPDILLLDEPTNHLDLPAIQWLERELEGLRSSLVLISHDRRFLETLSRKTLWLDRGGTRLLEEGFSAFEAWRDERLELEERERHKLDRKIAAEEDWMRYGVTARRKRNVRRVAELDALRQRKREAQRGGGQVRLEAAEGEASGKRVIEAKGITKAFDDRVIIKPFSVRIARGDRIGLVGPNGAGKTTLLRILTGGLEPDAGSLQRGTNLDMITLEQKRDELEPAMTVKNALTGGRGDQVMVNGQARHVVSYMKDFLFKPEQANTPLERLSGGERGRLMLARALAQPSNLMVLDEPTNDLDLETLDLLQDMLAAYTGTVLLVSHDRDFLDRVVTSVIAFEGDGHWQEYAGGYADMEVQRAAASTAAGQVKAPAPGKAATAKPSSPSEKARTDAGNAVEAKASPRKLSFKDKHALETLPGQIEALTAKAESLQGVLDDPDLFTRDPDKFAETVDALQATQEALAASEDEWLRLEILRDELASGT